MYSCGHMKEGQGGKGDRCCFAFSGGNTYDSSSCSNRVLYLKIRNKLWWAKLVTIYPSVKSVTPTLVAPLKPSIDSIIKVHVERCQKAPYLKFSCQIPSIFIPLINKRHSIRKHSLLVVNRLCFLILWCLFIKLDTSYCVLLCCLVYSIYLWFLT